MIKLKLIQNLSIKNKIVAIILLVTYLCLGLGFTFFAIWDMNRLKTEIQSNLTINAKLIGDNCIVPLTFNDKQQAAKALSRLRYIEFIEIACIHDKEGNLFASYPAILNHDSLITHNQHYNNIRKDGYFYVQEPIIFKDEIYGTIYLKANTQPLTDVKKTILLTLFLLSLVLIFLSLILAGRMQRYVSIPIMKLKKHFDKIAGNQDFSVQLTKQNNDEIGSLYDGFNNLTNQIQIRSKERDTAEANYQDTQNKLDLALQGGEIGIWEWNLATNLTIWDSNMENMFGLAEGEFNQSYDAFKACLHPDDISSAEKAIDDAIKGIAPYDTVYRVIWKNKEVKFIRAKALVVKDKEEKPISMIGICIDVSNIKKAEEELKKHRNELEHLVNERTKELKSKNSELEKMNKIFIGRELKMVELKEKIKELESKLN
jgi:PAS domain-containing protein